MYLILCLLYSNNVKLEYSFFCISADTIHRQQLPTETLWTVCKQNTEMCIPRPLKNSATLLDRRWDTDFTSSTFRLITSYRAFMWHALHLSKEVPTLRTNVDEIAYQNKTVKTLSGTFKGCCIVNKPPILWIVWNTGGIYKDEKGIIFITCAVANSRKLHAKLLFITRSPKCFRWNKNIPRNNLKSPKFRTSSHD